jgi:hypothetical protein
MVVRSVGLTLFSVKLPPESTHEVPLSLTMCAPELKMHWACEARDITKKHWIKITFFILI